MCLSENSIEPVISTSQVRTVFTDVTFVEGKPAVGHTHGKSAASRSSASLFIDTCGRELGRKVVFYQGSKSDVRNGRDYSRTVHWIKDQGVPPRPYAPAPGDCVAMVDVDYYVDMPKFLSNNFRPVFLYTCQPASVARLDGEYKYHFKDDGTIEYVVSGGATYNHLVWNYDGDSVKVRKFWKFMCFSVLTEVSSFSLERRQVDNDHQLILLAPMCKYKGLASWIADKVLDGKELRRLNPVVGKFTRLLTNEPDGIMIHTGLAGNYVKCTVPASDDVALNISSRVQKLDLQLAQVRKISKLDGEPTILWEFHRCQLPNLKPHMVSTAIQHVKRYQIVKSIADFQPHAKPSVVSFMNPLIDAAFAPDMCLENDKRSIESRVVNVKDNTSLTPFVAKVITEFIDKFVGNNRNHIIPVDLEEVYARQNTPQQRRILQEADMLPHGDRRVKSFMKREAYENVTDPRNISTINGNDKRDYSAFMYALADYIKEFEWYAFGKTPKMLAERVAEIAMTSLVGIIETDFSRMDGRVGEVPRALERQLCMALFKEDFHPELLELMRSQTGLQGNTRFGEFYESGLSRLSGSPETSVFNTILNVFTAYLTFRRTKLNGRYMTSEEAWNKLGVYGGDDGLTADAEAKVYAESAKMVGQVLTSELKSRGTPGVKFLSRLYGPEVWFGDCNSTCDLPRTMSKFHTTVALPDNIKPIDKLIDKAYALSLTDANTPIVGPFVKKALKFKPKKFVFKNYSRKWQVDVDSTEQYPNKYSEWMNSYARTALPEFSMAQFNDWINDVEDADGLMAVPSFNSSVEAKPAKGDITIVDGDVVTGGAEAPVVSSPPTKKKAQLEARKRSRPRKPKKDRPSRQDNNRRA